MTKKLDLHWSSLFSLMMLTVAHTRSFAQSTVFTYQGRLNVGGSPASGSYDLRFAIYDAVTNGVQQGSTLTNAATGVSNGLFTVSLNFGNQFPGADRWLDISVRTNGGAFALLSPRQSEPANERETRDGDAQGPNWRRFFRPACIIGAICSLAGFALGFSQ
jgi:hypothetical protein